MSACEIFWLNIIPVMLIQSISDVVQQQFIFRNPPLVLNNTFFYAINVFMIIA